MAGWSRILLSGENGRGYRGRRGRWGRPATGRCDAAAGYGRARLGWVSAGGHGAAAAGLPAWGVGASGVRRDRPARVLAAALVLLVSGAVLWRGSSNGPSAISHG